MPAILSQLPLSYQEDFDRILARSDCCKKSGLINLVPACHPLGAANVSYRDGVIVLRCGYCQRPYKRISVATIEERTT